MPSLPFFKVDIMSLFCFVSTPPPPPRSNVRTIPLMLLAGHQLLVKNVLCFLIFLVRNGREKLCAFVPHSPDSFWKEFTWKYPGIEETRFNFTVNMPLLS